MEKISAVIITFNEEKKLGACLASLQGVVDEVIVMDSFQQMEQQHYASKREFSFTNKPGRVMGHKKMMVQQRQVVITF